MTLMTLFNLALLASYVRRSRLGRVNHVDSYVAGWATVVASANILELWR